MNPELRDLAQRFGVQLTYEDATGKLRVASDEALRAVLRKRVQSIRPVIDPVIVEWDGERPHGYHERGRQVIFSAPVQAYAPPARTWGIFTPVREDYL
mgnify:CR=1 FL=1